jgi:hypothetical protein
MKILTFYIILIILGLVMYFGVKNTEGYGGRRATRSDRSYDFQDPDDIYGKGPYGNPLTPSDIYDDGYNYYPIYKYYRSFLYDPYFTYGWVPGGYNGCPLRQGCYQPVNFRNWGYYW